MPLLLFGLLLIWFGHLIFLGPDMNFQRRFNSIFNSFINWFSVHRRGNYKRALVEFYCTSVLEYFAMYREALGIGLWFFFFLQNILYTEKEWWGNNETLLTSVNIIMIGSWPHAFKRRSGQSKTILPSRMKITKGDIVARSTYGHVSIVSTILSFVTIRNVRYGVVKNSTISVILRNWLPFDK